MTLAEENQQALVRRLALEAAEKALHLARNAAVSIGDTTARDRLQRLLSAVLTEQDDLNMRISEIADQMLAEATGRIE